MSDTRFRDATLYRTKGADRINVNNLLAAVCVTILCLLVTVSSEGVNIWSVLQLAIAIPCLITSSLCYAKLAYRPAGELDTWNLAGWITSSIGYVCVLNATAVLLYVSQYRDAAWSFVGVNAALFLLYALIDVYIGSKVSGKRDKSRIKEKSIKTLFYLVLLLLGAVFPLVFKIS